MGSNDTNAEDAARTQPDDSGETPPGSPEIDYTDKFDDTVPIDEDTQVLDDVDFGTQVVDSEGEGTDVTEVLSDDGDNKVTEFGEAAHKMELAGTDGEAGSIQGNTQRLEVTGKESEVSNENIGREVDVTAAAKSTVRRLFNGDAPGSDSSLPEFVADDHEFAGLSYIGSQVPGDQSQADALNIVDRLISAEDELPQEFNWGSAAKGSSPPVSRTKGVHVLAQRVTPRSPVGDVDIFDWDDSHEDEGGGFFFSNRKEELLGGSCPRQRSNNQPKNSVPRNGKTGKGKTDKLKEEEKLPRKTKGCSASRSLLHNSNEDEKIQRISRSRTRKSDGQQKILNLSEQLEATGISKESMHVCDVGIDTQLAADAMEALGSGVPSNHATGVPCQAEQYDAKGCPRDESRNKVHSKEVPRQTTSFSGSMSRRSERIKKLDTSLTSKSSPKNSTDQTQRVISDSKCKGRKMSARKLLNTGAANQNQTCNTRSSKSVNQVHPVSEINEAHIKKVVTLPRSSSLHENSEEQVADGYSIVTPVAHRTRNSLAVDPSKGCNLSCDEIGNDVDDVVEARNEDGRRRRKGFVSEDTDKGKETRVNSIKLLASDENKTPEERTSKPIGKVNKFGAMNDTHINEADRLHGSPTSNGQKQEDCRIFTPVARRTRGSLSVNPLKGSEFSCKGSGDGTNVVKGSRGYKRQRSLGGDAIERNASGSHSSVLTGKSIQQEPFDCRSYEFSDVDAPTTAKKCEANGQSVMKQKKLRVSGTNGVKLDQKRITRSSVHPSELSSEKLPEGSIIEKPEVEPTIETLGPSYVEGKVDVLPSDLGGRKSIHKEPSVLTREKLAKIIPETREVHRFPRRKRTHENISKHTHEASVDAPPASHEIQTNGHKMGNKEKLKIDVTDSCPKTDHKSVKGVRVDARLHISPEGKVKQACTAGVIPSSNCTSPTNAASPLCIGNGYDEKLCKKSVTRSPLLKELNRLDANEVLCSSTFKDLRKRKDMSTVRVLFSHHLDGDTIRQQKKILVRLGASIAGSCSEATHFVTDMFARTRNMLEAIASGKPIVTHFWLESCAQASCLIDEKNYILRDSKKEKEIGFNMPASLAHANQSPLLESRLVYITPNVKPSQELIASLVKTVHGQVMEKLGTVIKDDKLPDDLLVLSCEEDYALCVPLLEKGAQVYGSELLLNGIVIQKLEYERHRLFTDYGRRTRSTIRVKGNADQVLPVAKRKKR